jgi:D-alanyl-D-alanine carboxypeptidase (penicillin-binding protein 5/6)
MGGLKLAGLGAALGWVLLGGGALAAPAPPQAIAARSAELLDGYSGKVLYALHANQKVPIASVTKLMTLYLAVQAVDQHRLALHELVPVSEEAYHVNGSQIWLEPGERLSVDHLLKAVAIGSANDAAYALGEYIAGSPQAFVEDMNRTALALGMHSTHFANPHGLHEASHYSTAHDLGILAQHAVRMPLLMHYTSMWEDRSVRNGKGGTLWMINHNRMLRQFPGMDGLKTGYTSQAGFCMVATAKRVNTRMIAVVLGAPSSKARFADAGTLLTWGFQHYRTHVLARQGEVAGQVQVRRGEARRVAAVYPKDLYLTLETSAQAVTQRVQLPQTVEAPVKRGEALGVLIARIPGQGDVRLPIVAQRTVARVGWQRAMWRNWWKISG